MRRRRRRRTPGGLTERSGVAEGRRQGTSRRRRQGRHRRRDPERHGSHHTGRSSPSHRRRTPFDEAVTFFQENDKGAWTKSKCDAVASRFQDVGGGKIAEAYFNAGVAYQKCSEWDDAQKMYDKALAINPNHGPSLGNLGEIAYRKGDRVKAQDLFDKAVHNDAHQQVSAARCNLAWLQYYQLRGATDQVERDKIEGDAIHNLQAALAIDNDNVVAYVVMALIYMEGAEKNRNRLDFAQLLLDEGKKRNEKFAPLWNASGILKMKKGNVGRALEDFRQAATLDPSYVEAHMNVGQIELSSRNYPEAEAQFRKVIELQPARYDALVGLGVALRGEATVLRAAGNNADFGKKIDEAEGSYSQALKADGKRGDAYYDLGLLYKDYRTNDADLSKNVAQYQKAKQYFQDYLSRAMPDDTKRLDAQGHIQDCDKYVEAINNSMKSQPTPAPAPPPAATPPPAPTAAPAKAPAPAVKPAGAK